jgi:hypothetical protein
MISCRIRPDASILECARSIEQGYQHLDFCCFAGSQPQSYKWPILESAEAQNRPPLLKTFFESDSGRCAWMAAFHPLRTLDGPRLSLTVELSTTRSPRRCVRAGGAGNHGSRMMSTRRLVTVGSLEPVWPIGSCWIMARETPSASSWSATIELRV